MNTSPTILGRRVLTLNAIIRVRQIEGSRRVAQGGNESSLHTPEAVKAFRQSIAAAWPEASITWGLSWQAIFIDDDNYRRIRSLLRQYHECYGDDVTFAPGGFFSNVFGSREQVNEDLHDGLAGLATFMGERYRPRSVIAGFLSSDNLQYLAKYEDIHVCQGNIFSQYSIDNQDGDGSICYPYYPSTEHFCKPAQNPGDQIDCVNLDGWTVDFLAARRNGFEDGFNSRLGVGPIETILSFGAQTGVRQMLATTAVHFDEGFSMNGFAWVANCCEIALVNNPELLEGMSSWLAQVHARWPDAVCMTQGEFGLLWRATYIDNARFSYRFSQQGTGIGGSDRDKRIKWYMNNQFRLAVLKSLDSPKDPEQVIDFTRYDIAAKEPADFSRNWTLFGAINQKRTREQDQPVAFSALSQDDRRLIALRYPELRS